MNKKWFLALVLVGLLPGCGGGGSQEAPPPTTVNPPPPADPASPPSTGFNVDAALGNVLSGGLTFSRQWTDPAFGGLEYTVSYSPMSDGDLLGQTYKRSMRRAYFSVNGEQRSASNVTLFYALNPTRVAASVNDKGNLTIYESTGDLPRSISDGGDVSRSTVGDFSRSTSYVSATDRTVIEQGGIQWVFGMSLYGENPWGTPWACLHAVNGGTTFTEECFRIDHAGTVLGGISMLYHLSGRALLWFSVIPFWE